MKKLLATILAVAMILSLMPMALGEGAQDPITLTVFRGDPGDQPAEDNKIYKLIEEEFGIKFKFEFLAGNLDENLGMKIFGQDYPDLFDGGNSADLIIERRRPDQPAGLHQPRKDPPPVGPHRAPEGPSDREG